MPARFWILKALLGLLCVGFAYLWGRSLGRPQASAKRYTGRAGWAVRTLVAGAALQWGPGSAVIPLGFYGLGIVSGVAGFLLARRPKEPEQDLTETIFHSK